MKIICKEKDYYDYVGYQESYDFVDDVVFDRRNMNMIESGQNSKETGIDNFVSSIVDNSLDGKTVGVWIGFTLYIFKIWADPDRWISNSVEKLLKPNFTWTAELLASRREYDTVHPNPIEFVYIKTPIFEHSNWRLYSWKDWKNFNTAKKNPSLYINEYKTGNIANWQLKNVYSDDCYKVPILKNTWIPKYVPAQEAYYGIEEWLIAQHNDVDQESEGLTDVDKAINHGFDAKVSFRNVK